MVITKKSFTFNVIVKKLVIYYQLKKLLTIRVKEREVCDMSEKIGFVGLGNMGFPMVRNLINAGYKVCGFDVDKEKEAQLLKIGGSVGFTLETLTKEVDVIFSSLPTPQIVESVYFDAGGLIDHSFEGKTLIDLSTISPELDREIGKSAEENGTKYLGSPVSGSVSGAENATLSIMVGGEKNSYDSALQHLEVLGKNIFHVGEDYGAGTMVKLINNLLAGIHTQAAAEALSIADAVGLSHQTIHKILKESTGQSAMLTRNYTNFISQDEYHEGRFTNSLLLKDVKLANQVSESYDNELILGKKLSEYLDENISGFENMDMASTYLMLTQNKSSKI